MRLVVVVIAVAAALLTCAPAQALEVGIADEDALLDVGRRPMLLQRGGELGARRVRLNVYWHRVRDRGWADYDAAIDAARARGFRVQVTLTGAPAWQPDLQLSHIRPDPRLMWYFASLAASHFGPRVDRYSVWNEPNHYLFLRQKGAARRYRRLYDAGRRAIKKVNPKAAVLLGELCPCPGAQKFLRQVIGRRPITAEGFAHHPYQPYAPAGRRVPGRAADWTLTHLPRLARELRRLARRRLLRTPRGGTLPLYLTEFGVPAAMPEGRRGWWLRRAVRYARRVPGVRQLVLYQLFPTGRTDWDTSLLTEDGGPKLSFAKLAGALREPVSRLPTG